MIVVFLCEYDVIFVGDEIVGWIEVELIGFFVID